MENSDQAQPPAWPCYALHQHNGLCGCPDQSLCCPPVSLHHLRATRILSLPPWRLFLPLCLALTCLTQSRMACPGPAQSLPSPRQHPCGLSILPSTRSSEVQGPTPETMEAETPAAVIPVVTPLPPSLGAVRPMWRHRTQQLSLQMWKLQPLALFRTKVNGRAWAGEMAAGSSGSY